MANFDLMKAIKQSERRGKKFGEVLDALDLLYVEYGKAMRAEDDEFTETLHALMALYGEWKSKKMEA